MPAASRLKKGKETPATEDGAIVVTSQQSRFHVDADDAPTSKDIDIRDLTVTVGGREIVEHVNLSIKEGGRYALLGRNGLGKSTILRALAERRIPGVPSNLRILLLGQTLVDTDDAGSSSQYDASQSVLKFVISSDKNRERLLRESNLLSAALEHKDGSSEAVVEVTRRLRHDHAKRDLEQAKLIASRRSGARGAKARQVLIEKEKAEKEAEEIREAPSTSADLQKEIDAAIGMLEAVQIDLDSMDSSSTEARARSILLGLGFTQEQVENPMANLSGGWQKRAAFAGALVQKTDVLLLDEPTNFLDLPAVIWLQHYLTDSLSPSTSLVVTTHDHEFANAVADHLIIIRLIPAKTLETFKGTLTDYISEQRRQHKRMTKMAAALDRKQKHMESTISKSMTAAKRTGDDKKLKQAASRKKKLEERSGMEVNAKGHRFKLNRDRAGFHTSLRNDVEVPEFDPPVSITIPDQPPPLRNPGSLASFENVYFTYPKTKTQILDDITLTIQPNSRTGIVGLNGSGKSTLINLLTSTTYRPNKGTLALHPTARMAHYTQHHPTQLQTLSSTISDSSNPTQILTPLSHLHNLHPDIPEQTLRALLSSLSLHSTHQTTPLSSLSGGQLVRVSLATCLLPSPPHLLILDEPTTHLDSDTIMALISALRRYNGALLVVSHDRFLVRCVVEGVRVRDAIAEARGEDAVRDVDDDDDDGGESDDSSDDDENGGKKSPGKVYRLTKTGKLRSLDGGMDEYEELIVKQLAKKGIQV